MPQFKDKLQVFIMGLMLGLLIGGGFFILKLDNYFRELNFYKRISTKQEVKQEEKSEVKPVAEVKTNNTINFGFKSAKIDASTDSLFKAHDAVMRKADSLLIADSLRSHPIIEEGTAEAEIIVKKDE